MADKEVIVDTTKITGTKKSITWKGVWFYIRNFAVVIFVAWIMYDNIHDSNCNLVAMIFFALIGISSLIEMGFKVDNVIKSWSKNTKEINDNIAS